MGTKSTTDQQTKFDPTSMGQFQQLQPQFGQTVGGYMSNPFGNPFMQTQQQLGTRQAQNQGATGMENISRNITASGMGGGNMSPMALEMMQNQGRANSGLQANLGFLGPMQNALGMQQNAMGLAGNYKPLQTGGTTTQTTGGLGTWLPQLAGGAMGMMTRMGGLGGLMGGGGGGGLSPFQSAQGLSQGQAPSMGSGFYGGAFNAPSGFQGSMGSMGGQPGFMGGMPPSAPGMGGGGMPSGMGNSWWPGQG